MRSANASASWYPLRASSLMCWGGNSGLVDSRESQKNHEREQAAMKARAMGDELLATTNEN
jgi:hypothetical protein